MQLNLEGRLLNSQSCSYRGFFIELPLPGDSQKESGKLQVFGGALKENPLKMFFHLGIPCDYFSLN